MKQRFKTAAFHSLVVVALLGCSASADIAGDAFPKPGSHCTVQFRRDALGVAAEFAVAPRTDVFNGSETHVRGTLKHIDREWLVLDSRDEELWIPKSLILLIRSRPE